VGKPFGPRQHGHEKCDEGSGGIDVGGFPADRHVLPNLFDQPQLVKKNYENGSAAQRRHRTLCLA
jgi:hypothetical protein